MQELDVAFGRFQRERVDARPVLSHSVYLPAVELNDGLVAATDVEDEGKAAVLLLKSDRLILEHAFAGTGRSDGEANLHTIHVRVLEKRSSAAGLQHVQVFSVEIFLAQVPNVRSEDAG